MNAGSISNKASSHIKSNIIFLYLTNIKLESCCLPQMCEISIYHKFENQIFNLFSVAGNINSYFFPVRTCRSFLGGADQVTSWSSQRGLESWSRHWRSAGHCKNGCLWYVAVTFVPGRCLQNEDTGQHVTEEEDHFNSWGKKDGITTF